MKRVIAALMLCGGPAQAEDAVAWLAGRSDVAVTMQEVATLDMAEGGVIVADALIADGFDRYTVIATPSGPARLVVAFDPAEDGRPSKAMLVFSDAPVLCGQDVATVGIDTGLAGFFDRPTLVAMARDAAALGPGKDLYNDWFAALIGKTPVVAGLVPLPSGGAVPMVSSGWGDGGYPVAVLT
ncbi:MAG: DUF4241 domain-containing protein, partial [Pseudorhodobacter sp.]